jgi:hypothetical protein
MNRRANAGTYDGDPIPPARRRRRLEGGSLTVLHYNISLRRVTVQ